MSPAELERAIVAPADQAGLVVEPRLLAEMIADVADRPGALPLLQYALTELAERPDGRTLTLDAYRRIGRVSGALARRAEALFEPMNERARDACQQLFLRLVTLGEGTEDTRRRVRRSELATLADPETMDAVIETFGRHRLLSFDRDPDTSEPTVEIAHEALLREWARLRGWIDDAREALRQRARISSGTQEWIACGSKLRLPAFGDPARAGRGGRRRRHGSPHGERTRVPRRERGPQGCRGDGRADAPRARAHPRATSPDAASRAGRRACGGAGPRRVADRRLRRPESAKPSDGATNRRSRLSPPRRCRTSTSTRTRACSLPFTP